MRIILAGFLAGLLVFGCSKFSFESEGKKEDVVNVVQKDCPEPAIKTVVKTVVLPDKKQECEKVGLTLQDSYGDHFRITGCKNKVDKINSKSIIEAIRILVN